MSKVEINSLPLGTVVSMTLEGVVTDMGYKDGGKYVKPSLSNIAFVDGHGIYRDVKESHVVKPELKEYDIVRSVSGALFVHSTYMYGGDKVFKSLAGGFEYSWEEIGPVIKMKVVEA